MTARRMVVIVPVGVPVCGETAATWMFECAVGSSTRPPKLGVECSLDSARLNETTARASFRSSGVIRSAIPHVCIVIDTNADRAGLDRRSPACFAYQAERPGRPALTLARLDLQHLTLTEERVACMQQSTPSSWAMASPRQRPSAISIRFYPFNLMSTISIVSKRLVPGGRRRVQTDKGSTRRWRPRASTRCRKARASC